MQCDARQFELRKPVEHKTRGGVAKTSAVAALPFCIYAFMLTANPAQRAHICGAALPVCLPRAGQGSLAQIVWHATDRSPYICKKGT